MHVADQSEVKRKIPQFLWIRNDELDWEKSGWRHYVAAGALNGSFLTRVRHQKL